MKQVKSKIQEAVTELLEAHYAGDKKSNRLYREIIAAVEQPLLTSVMEKCRHNQSSAAIELGINRNTLRSKLAQHGLLGNDDYA